MAPVLLVIAATAAQPSLDRLKPATVTTRATVIILKPAIGSKARWDRTPRSERKEVTLTDEKGVETRIRLIEFE